MTNQYTTTTQIAWTLAADGSGNKYFVPHAASDNMLSSPDAYAHTETVWPSQLGDIAGQRLVIPVDTAANNAMLKFFGKPASNPAGYAPPPPPPPPPPNNMYMGVGAIWGVSELTGSPNEYVGEWLCQFDITVGHDGIGSSSVLPTDGTFGRRATVRRDRSMLPGARTTNVQGDASPVLILDSLGYSRLIVELRCGQPANSSKARSGQWAWGDAITMPATDLGFMYRFM